MRLILVVVYVHGFSMCRVAILAMCVWKCLLCFLEEDEERSS